jgi:hypothetical protein
MTVYEHRIPGAAADMLKRQVSQTQPEGYAVAFAVEQATGARRWVLAVTAGLVIADAEWALQRPSVDQCNGLAEAADSTVPESVPDSTTYTAAVGALIVFEPVGPRLYSTPGQSECHYFGKSAGLAVAVKLLGSRVSGVLLAFVAQSSSLVLDLRSVVGVVTAAWYRYSALVVVAVGCRRGD